MKADCDAPFNVPFNVPADSLRSMGLESELPTVWVAPDWHPTELQTWLDRDDRELVDAAENLRSRGDQFYGYAILPGESDSVDNLVAAFNRISDLDPEHSTDTYYRYSVDEWANCEHDEFSNSNRLIESRNAQFKNLRGKAGSADYVMDEFEIAHVAKLHGAIITALAELRADGLFAGGQSFLVVWIPDSAHDIIYESVKKLKDAPLYELFMEEFGD